ncbi:hypothetical protein ES703_25754 [subsurface metagenome]
MPEPFETFLEFICVYLICRFSKVLKNFHAFKFIILYLIKQIKFNSRNIFVSVSIIKATIKHLCVLWSYWQQKVSLNRINKNTVTQDMAFNR